MQRFFSILADGVQRFEGTVDKFTGDGIMAVFGAPIAHEDHARRACYAALQMLDDVAEYAAELRREHGLNFSVRIGINSGEVVAGAIGEGERRRLHRDRPHGRPGAADGGAGRARQGLPDRARRRARRTASSSWRTSASSRSRARAGRSGSSSWSGSARRARGSTSRASAASPASSAAPRRWRRWRRRSSAAEAGEGAVVGIVAEPGVGKSRLCHEFAERCRARGIEVFEAQAPGARPGDPVHAGAADAARLLRDRRSRRRSGSPARRSPAGRCCSTPTSPTTCRCSSTSSACPTPTGPLPQMSAEARQRRAARRRLPARPGPQPPRAGRQRDRGPALDGRGAARRCSASCSARSRGRKTLAIVNFRPEYDAGVGRARRSTAGSRWSRSGRSRHARAAARPGRRGPLARRPRRADPRAHRRQPVLHRGDRPRAGRGRPPRGRARRLPAGAAGRGHRGPGHACRRSWRPGSTGSSPSAKRAAAGGVGDRQGGRASRRSA